MTGSDIDSPLHWYQRTWLWVAVAVAAVPVASLIPGNYLSVQSRIVSALAVVVMGLAPIGLWMAALVAQRPRARRLLSILTLVVLGLLIWSVWNGLLDVERDAFDGCFLVETADGQVVERDPELCASVMSGDPFHSFRRNTWILVAATWVAPLFVLYFLRKRFQPPGIENEVSARTQLVVGILLMMVGLGYVIGLANFILGSLSTAEPVFTTLDVLAGATGTSVVTNLQTTPTIVSGTIESGLTPFVPFLIAVTLVPGALLIRSARRRRHQQPTSEPSNQHQEE